MTMDKSDLIGLGEITPNNLGQLRKLNSVIFPVVYNDKFYTSVLESPQLARLAYFNDCPVGAVCVRKDVAADKTCELYIMTLGVLAPYRRLGVGKALLDYILSLTKQVPNVKAVSLHVQMGNEDALQFYQKHGFAVVSTQQDYYKHVTPADAHLLKKFLDGSAS